MRSYTALFEQATGAAVKDGKDRPTYIAAMRSYTAPILQATGAAPVEDSKDSADLHCGQAQLHCAMCAGHWRCIAKYGINRAAL